MSTDFDASAVRCDRVRDGLFFSRPAELPRGRHSMSRGEVDNAHRERLMIAATELVAKNGYTTIGVREICAHARASRSAFYSVFANKNECVFSAYTRCIEVLQRRLAAAVSAETLNGTVRSLIETYLQILDLDPVVARAFQVEMDYAGREGRARRREGMSSIARVLKVERDRAWPGSETIPDTTYLAVAYGVRQLTADRLDDADARPLIELAPEVIRFATSALTLT